jgi:hypothetical protein
MMPLNYQQLVRLLLIASAPILGVISSPSSASDVAGKATMSSSYEELIAKARSKGAVRVIVGLRMDFKPEGNLPNQEAVQKQRQTIDSLQDALLERLAPHGVSLVTRSKYAPSMAIEVSAPALKVLIGAPEVASISEDTPVPPAAR